MPSITPASAGMEQALYLLRTLTRDAATDPEVRTIVDTRETWIIFSHNPDGHVYDLTGHPYRLCAEPQPPRARSTWGRTSTATTTTAGVLRGSSGARGAFDYRGPAPFSAPETRVLRDFVESRVIDGRQQIRAT